MKMKLMTLSSDSDLDSYSSLESDSGRDPWELDEQPRDLMELYFVMDSTRYFVEQTVTPKSREFSRKFSHNFPDGMSR